MNIFCVSSEAFVDEANPTIDELDACTNAAYCAAWSARYGMECNEVQIDSNGMSRIRARITWLANKRRKQDESFGAAYVRTAHEFFRAWLAFEGRGDDKWLVKRYHPMQALADGMRNAQDADLNFATDTVLSLDKQAAKREEKRAAKGIELVRDVPGPEGKRKYGEFAPLTFKAPPAVAARMGASNA